MFTRLQNDAVFFNWVQTSIRLCGSGSQNFLGKLRLILKLRAVKICPSLFFPKLLKKCEKSSLKIRSLIDINWSSLKTLLI